MTASPCVQQALSSASFGGTPTDFAAPSTAVHCRSVEKCGCSGTFKAKNPFKRKDLCKWIDQLDMTGASKGAGTGAGPWNADVVLDGAAKQITVTHKMRFVNLTGHRRYGVSQGIAAVLAPAEFTARTAAIPAGIKAWWNAKPYQIKIKDHECGEHTYKIFFNPAEVTSGEHYTVDLYNVPYDTVRGSTNVIYFTNGDRTLPRPPQTEIKHPTASNLTLGRSFVRQTEYSCSWNLADTRTCTDTHGPGHTGYNDMLEPHEFAHMLGLKDAYIDAARGINGLRFHTRGDIGSASDDVVMTGSATTSHPGMLGSMTNFSDFHQAYALTVAYVVIRHMNEVWGHQVEDWEILS